MLKFTATPQALIEIARKAINASSPVGMGYLHYEQKEYTEKDMMEQGVDVLNHRGCFVDYFCGRMVKLRIFKVKDKERTYEVDNTLYLDYQSFGKVYKDMRQLLESVEDVEILQ